MARAKFSRVPAGGGLTAQDLRAQPLAVTGPPEAGMPLPVTVQTLPPARPTATQRTSAPAAAVDTSLLPANANRYGATIYNDADKTLYLALGTIAASASNFTCKVLAGGYYETPFTYTGAIRGLWDPAPTGAARISEVL
jgi:hypothetical protein